MKYRVLSCLLGVVALVIAIYDYEWLQSIGFPDGHATDLDGARIPLYSLFIVLSAAFSIYCWYVAIAAQSKDLPMRLLRTVSLYLFIFSVTAVVDYCFSSYLDHGAGG